VGGVPELIEHGVNGFIFQPGDIQQMIQYVQKLIDEPDLRQSMAEAAHQSIQHLTWPAIMHELFDDYRRLIEEHSKT
jgi:glycosyltransferase involved in cell wall biosynthesis